MKDNHDEQKLLHQIQQQLDEPLDAQTHADLARLRQNALRHARQQPERPRWLMPVATLATAAGIGALSVTLWINQPDLSAQQAQLIADLEILGADDELELYQEMDFLLWLEEQHEAG